MLINKNTFSNKLLNKYIYWSGIITLLFILITSYVNYVNKHFPEQIYITEQSDTSINLSLPVTGSVHNTQNGTNNSPHRPSSVRLLIFKDSKCQCG